MTQLELSVLEMYGYPPAELQNDGLIVKEVPPTFLLGRSTVCGSLDNHAFTDAVVNFLQASGVTSLGVILDDTTGDVHLAAGKMTEGQAMTLEEMLRENGGSFRSGDVTSHGHQGFESE